MKPKTGKLSAMWVLLRPHSCAAGAVTHFAALRLVSGPQDPWTRGMLLGPLAVFLIVGGANVINDVFDIEVDRVNAPDRPLPSALVSTSFARALSLLLFSSGAALSAAIGPAAGLFALAQVGVLTVYGRYSKKMGLAKNPVFAAYCASVVVFAGVVAGRANGFLAVMTACCFFMMMAMEIVKDIPDAVGDAAAGATTLPIRLGEPAAVRLTIAMGVVTWVIALTPYFLGWADARSFWMTNAGFLIGLYPFRKPPPPPATKAYILAGTMLGLAGFFVGKL